MTSAAARHDERGSTSALELMALTPMCALLVALISWAGNTGQAQLAATLAAQEAAVAAALCCPHADSAADAAYDSRIARQLTAEAVIATRPSLERLCVGGPQPGNADSAWVSYTAAAPTGHQPDAPDGARDRPGGRENDAEAAAAGTGVAVVTAHLVCIADGAAAPLRGLFGTRTVHGHGTYVTRTAAARTPDEARTPAPNTSDTGDTP